MDYPYIYQPAGQPAAYTLLLLHGTGGDETDLVPLAREFGQGFNVLSLRGNVSEGGMPRFFRRLGMGIFDEKDLSFRTGQLVGFVRELAEKEHFDASKVIALGYSNGANIAGSALLMYPGWLAGAILYRPMQPFKGVDPAIKSPRPVPVFMSNGAADPTIRPADTAAYVYLLRQAGYEVAAHALPAGHNLTHQDVKLSVEWLKQNFQ